MIHLGENSLIFCQILSTNSLKKFMDNGLENLFADIGASKKKQPQKIHIINVSFFRIYIRRHLIFFRTLR